MHSFTYYSPTKLIFGIDSVKDNLAKELVARGYKKVLVTYGGGSVKRNGSYEQVMSALKEANCTVFEFSGIEPNPRVTSVDAAAAICKREGIELVIALGAGSTMDASKAICAAAYYDGAAWDLVLDNSKVTKALPLFTVNTLAATGSEYDDGAVISNLATNEKLPLLNEHLWPEVSFLDPSFTYTVPVSQTVAGSCDMISHFLEVYFSRELSPIAQGLIEACVKTALKYTPIALKEPNNAEARANLLWTSTLGCNGITGLGNSGTAFPCHAIEHEVSAYYDITHGIGLAIITPHLLRAFLAKDESLAPRYIDFAINIMGLKREDYASDKELIEAGIKALESFFAQIGVPKSFTVLNEQTGSKVSDEHFEAMAKHIDSHWFAKLEHFYAPFTVADVVGVLKACM